MEILLVPIHPLLSRSLQIKSTLNIGVMKRKSLLSLGGKVIIITALFYASCQKNMKESKIENQATETASLQKISQSRLDLQLIAGNLVSPIYLTEAPDNSHRLFVVDEIGKVWIIDANGNRLAQPFIDISSRMVTLMPGYDERGLLGLAFHPDFTTNHKFYLFYTAPPPPGGPSVNACNTALPMTWNNTTTISEFTVSSNNANVADLNSERKIFEEPHPQFNHNGGTIMFGTDGYLYISIGDGGNKNDIGPGHVEDWYAFNCGGNGQDITSNLLGNVLRIDVNGSANGKNYSIPSDNPFVGKEGLDEIWAYGFRNPYRFSFDMSGSRRMFLGDAGQNRYEEIDVVTKGSNYGWNVKEGFECFNAADEFAEVENCPSVDIYVNRLTDPVIQQNNAANPEGGNFAVIIGGYVYRGHTVPGLQGKYLYANATSNPAVPAGEIYVSQPEGPGPWASNKISFKSFPENVGNYVKGFGQDLNGEVYVLGSAVLGPTGVTGKVFKIVQAEK
jgi:glucose/arabinose dehydrogenase